MGSYTSVIVIVIAIVAIVVVVVVASLLVVVVDGGVVAMVHYKIMCHKLFVALALAVWLRTFAGAAFATLDFGCFIYLYTTDNHK